MKNNFKFILIVLFWIFSLQAVVFAQPPHRCSIINHAKDYDNKVVPYLAEAIGDVMLRGEFAWVNFSDGKDAIGVWMPAVMAKEINFTGNYKTRGDRFVVTGVLHSACLEHGGDLDIHATSVLKVDQGGAVKEKLNFDRVKAGIILLGALLLIWILTQFMPR